jgi:molecular chaperone HtpG
MISFDEYINNCKEDQKTIYYLSGEDSKKLLTSPQIEGFLNKGVDVLLFTDAVDNFWVNTNSKYKDYEIKSVTKSNIDLENSADKKANSEETKNVKEKKIKKDDDKYSKLLECFKQVLGNLVKDVKISKKLTTSLACLTVADNAMDFQMERLLAEHKKSFAGSTKILELNPKHKIIKKINNDLKDLKLENNNSINDNENMIKLIFDQACIIEGEAVHDTVDFAKRFDDILEKVILLNVASEKQQKDKLRIRNRKNK